MATIVIKRPKEFALTIWEFKVEFPYVAEVTKEGFVIVPDEDGDDSEYALDNFIIDETTE